MSAPADPPALSPTQEESPIAGSAVARIAPVTVGSPIPEPAASSSARHLAAAFFARYAGTTLRTYQYKLAGLSRWLGVPLVELPAWLLEKGPAHLHLDVERYRAYLRDERQSSPATINGALAAIRTLVRFLHRAQLCTWTLDISSERQTSYRDTRGPGIAAIRALLRAASTQPNRLKAARDVAVIRLLVDRALRRGEVVGLDVEHVELDLDARPISIFVRGKGSAERERLSLPPKTRAAVAAWLAVRGVAEGPLFVSLDPGAGRVGRGGKARAPVERLTGEGIARTLSALARQANLAGAVRPHGMRHTAITALLDQGVGIREAQRFSRHADPRTLMRYDDNRQDLAGEMAITVSELL